MSEQMADRGPDDRERAMAELARIRLDDQPLTKVLERVAQLAKEVLPDARDVSVTLLDDARAASSGPARAKTVAFTGDLAVDLDERQYRSGFGPCLDVAVSGETILVDTSDDSRYPEFSAAARRRGVTHSLSVGLPIPQRTIGALNIYGSAGPFTDREVESAHAFAGHAAVAVANAALFAGTADLARNLQIAMASRAVIEQAKGIVMAQRRCSADEAFELLRAASQRQNVKLRVLCQSIVDSATSRN
jgi:GAF domain-containing protein